MGRTREWLRQAAPHDLPLIVLGVMGVLSLLISPVRSTTLPAVLLLGGGLALSALAARWPHTERDLALAWLSLSLGVALLSLVGLWGLEAKQRVVFAELQQVLRAILTWRNRMVGRFPDTFHPNVLAGALVVLLPFSLSAALRLLAGDPLSRRDRILSIVSAVAWLLGCGVVLLTQSRGAYLGLAASLLVVAVIWPRSLWVLAPLAAVGGAGFVLGGGWGGLADGASLGEALFGLSWRRVVWQNGLAVLSSYPYTGVGMGCFRSVNTSFFPMVGAASVDASHAHNLFLQVGIDLGLPGLIAYLATLGLSFYLLGRAYRKTRGAGRLLAVAGIAALAALCVHGLV
ncbi:MAG: O-antigen ligase family protein, partial [Chloroflexi bacterium]|nr:O-antigen ligase family protein [Chloroflexota bacterium]